MDFKEQIKHPKWQKKRLEILERDGYICQRCCNDEKQLHVHHLIYHKGKNLWEYNNKYLSTLCEDCHKTWHDTNDMIKEMLCVGSDRLEQIFEILDLLFDVDIMDLVSYRAIIEEVKKIKEY